MSQVDGVVMRLEDVKPYMKVTYGFTRFHVTTALVRMLGRTRKEYDGKASRILARARKEGLIKFSNGKARSTYYVFADV